jgi:Ni/Co efflux regulator RcnB
MKLHRILVALAGTALLAAPVAAFAQDQGQQNGDHGWYQRHDRNGEHRDRDRRDRDDRDYHRDRDRGDRDRGERGDYNRGYQNGQGGYYGRGDYNRGGYGPNGGYYGGYSRNGNRVGGTVSSFSPFNLYLQNGTHVELHQGTVINPNGATPQPGQRVQVFGHWNNDGTFAADQINLG